MVDFRWQIVCQFFREKQAHNLSPKTSPHSSLKDNKICHLDLSLGASSPNFSFCCRGEAGGMKLNVLNFYPVLNDLAKRSGRNTARRCAWPKGSEMVKTCDQHFQLESPKPRWVGGLSIKIKHFRRDELILMENTCFGTGGR